MILYSYLSPIGRMFICPNQHGRFDLVINNEFRSSYKNAIQAADDVYCQATGYYDWDTLECYNIPTDISEWEIIKR